MPAEGTQPLTDFVKKALTRRITNKTGFGRRMLRQCWRLEPDERLVLGTKFAIAFTFCLSAIEIANLAVMGTWNSEVFAAITGLSGTIMGISDFPKVELRRRTYLDPNIQPLQKTYRGGRAHLRPKRFLQKRISNLTQKFDGDTQNIRSQLILDLRSLLEIATEQSISTGGQKSVERQNWVRLAAYISQVINGISKTYDITQIKDELEELRKTIAEMDKQ